MNDKVNFRLLNLLITIAIVCLLYTIRGLWIGIVVNIFNVIAPFLLAFALLLSNLLVMPVSAGVNDFYFSDFIHLIVTSYINFIIY